MGDRGQVFVKDAGVYLYTHWNASNLIETVRQALAKKWRWDDPEYLARIIFCEMVRGSETDETGYGIGTQEHGDIWLLITVDTETQTDTIKDDEDPTNKYSFSEFTDKAVSQE
jgi:hypothetical protein